ncbi:DUF721 domain-containing protein [Streptomyces lunaelactis]|nr:DUF721 domain-containing protein [Streptomyces lunaelactis]
MSTPADHIVVAQWDAIAPELAHGLTPVTFDPSTGALVLRPASPAWATQIRLLGSKIISRLNECLAAETVQTIRLLLPNADLRVDRDGGASRAGDRGCPRATGPADARRARAPLLRRPDGARSRASRLNNEW